MTVATIDEFHDEHQRRNGYTLADTDLEVIAVRARATAPSDVDVDASPDLARAGAIGPSVIVEEDCTIWVPEGWRAVAGAAGALVLTRR